MVLSLVTGPALAISEDGGGTVTALDGKVLISSPDNGKPTQLNVATVVQTGHVIQTSPGSSTSVLFSDTLVIAGENTRVVVEQTPETRTGQAALILTVEHGIVRVVVDETAPRVEVRTPDVTVAVSAHVVVSVEESRFGSESKTVTQVVHLGPSGTLTLHSSDSHQEIRTGQVAMVRSGGLSTMEVQTYSQASSWLAVTASKHAAVVTLPPELVRHSMEAFLSASISHPGMSRPGTLPPLPVPFGTSRPATALSQLPIQLPQTTFTPPAVLSGAAQGSSHTSINQVTVIQTPSGTSTSTSAPPEIPPLPNLPNVRVPIPSSVR